MTNQQLTGVRPDRNMSSSSKWFLGILGVLLLLALGFTFLIFSVVRPTGSTEVVTSGSGDRIGVVELKGEIVSAEETVRQVKMYREDRSIRAILLRIDSPGGGPVASQEMYEEVKKTRDSGKPVVVSMGSLAASGGYYVACGASKIVANRATLTGSIGVVSQILQLQDALAKVGIEVKTIKTGTLKDAGSSTRKMNDVDRKYFEELLDDVLKQFIAVVATERKLDPAAVRALADGRVFTGEQAVSLKLIDTLGTYEDAIKIAASIAGIRGEPALVKERKRRSFWDGVWGGVSDAAASLRQEIVDRPVISYKYTGQ
jgi:protease-4